MMRILRFAAVVAAFLATPALAQDYLLQVGDTVDVFVLEDPSLNRQALVRPDGKISLPLAGTIQAEGRTPEQLQSAIRRALAPDFIQPPTVTVALASLGDIEEEEEEVGVATVFVLGAVNRPGSYTIELPLNILQALAVSGGPGVFAATNRIQVRRRTDGADTVLLFDFERVIDGVVPSGAFDLQDGDVIIVPERGLFN